MKSPATSDVCWTVALWLSFFVIVVIFAFGATVQVDFNDPSIPFSQALESTKWERALPDPRGGEYHLIFAISVAAIILHTFHRSWRIRLAAMTAAFLTPVFTIGAVMLWVAVVAPWMIFNALAGKVDGEFYGEGTLMIAAIGLWMLVCLVYAVREARERKKPSSRTRTAFQNPG